MCQLRAPAQTSIVLSPCGGLGLPIPTPSSFSIGCDGWNYAASNFVYTTGAGYDWSLTVSPAAALAGDYYGEFSGQEAIGLDACGDTLDFTVIAGPGGSGSSSSRSSGSRRSSGSSTGGIVGGTDVCTGECSIVSLSLDCIGCPGFSAGDWNILDPGGYMIANQTTPNGWTVTIISSVPPEAQVCAPEGAGGRADTLLYVCTIAPSSSGSSGSRSSGASSSSSIPAVACYSALLNVMNCSSSSAGGGGSLSSGSRGSRSSGGSGFSLNSSLSSSSGAHTYINCDRFHLFSVCAAGESTACSSRSGGRLYSILA